MSDFKAKMHQNRFGWGSAHWRRSLSGSAGSGPLFAPNGQAMMFALPHFALVKLLKRAFLVLFCGVNLFILTYIVGKMSTKHGCIITQILDETAVTENPLQCLSLEQYCC